MIIELQAAEADANAKERIKKEKHERSMRELKRQKRMALMPMHRNTKEFIMTDSHHKERPQASPEEAKTHTAGLRKVNSFIGGSRALKMPSKAALKPPLEVTESILMNNITSRAAGK